MITQVFGKTDDGRTVHLYALVNRRGTEVKITNYGGAVVSLKCPDGNGAVEDVALGYDDLAGYLTDQALFGAIVGRYAGRIAYGRFTLDGVGYVLPRNDGEHHLHGGSRGFHKQVWSVEPLSDSPDGRLTLTYRSRDGEEGYPGNLTVSVAYVLTDDNELRIDYSAFTDKLTVMNLTNHCYFNLAGHAAGDIRNHRLTIHASRFAPIDATLIPTGEFRPVAGTPFDFSQSATLGARMESEDTQLKLGRGYDHSWALNPAGGESLSLAAEVYEPSTGRVLEVWTTEPALHVYTGNFLDGNIRGKNGAVYKRHYGVCLEAQHFSDSPNRSTFPSTVLRPDREFRSTTVYRFSVA